MYHGLDGVLGATRAVLLSHELEILGKTYEMMDYSVQSKQIDLQTGIYSQDIPANMSQKGTFC